jgi:hypothetical protein
MGEGHNWPSHEYQGSPCVSSPLFSCRSSFLSRNVISFLPQHRLELIESSFPQVMFSSSHPHHFSQSDHLFTPWFRYLPAIPWCLSFRTISHQKSVLIAVPLQSGRRHIIEVGRLWFSHEISRLGDLKKEESPIWVTWVCDNLSIWIFSRHATDRRLSCNGRRIPWITARHRQFSLWPIEWSQRLLANARRIAFRVYRVV